MENYHGRCACGCGDPRLANGDPATPSFWSARFWVWRKGIVLSPEKTQEEAGLVSGGGLCREEMDGNLFDFFFFL